MWVLFSFRCTLGQNFRLLSSVLLSKSIFSVSHFPRGIMVCLVHNSTIVLFPAMDLILLAFGYLNRFMTVAENALLNQQQQTLSTNSMQIPPILCNHSQLLFGCHHQHGRRCRHPPLRRPTTIQRTNHDEHQHSRTTQAEAATFWKNAIFTPQLPQIPPEKHQKTRRSNFSAEITANQRTFPTIFPDFPPLNYASKRENG